MTMQAPKLTISNLVRLKPVGVGTTWLLTLMETCLMALVPLFTGFAIDGLLQGETGTLFQLGGLLGTLVVLGVGRRIYDTRIYGTLRAELSGQLADPENVESVSSTNARVGMGRELVDFLEEQLPELLDSVVQLTVSLIVLYWFHPTLSVTAMAATVLIIVIYLLFHHRFYRLNSKLNHRTEKQVDAIGSGLPETISLHFKKLRRTEINLSDTEAVLYGLIFVVLLTLILFNIWFATIELSITAGSIFSIVSYSWEFVAAALVLPSTLQHWTRLSEIMDRINAPVQPVT